ncbi:MAG: HAMP domain-containing protein, partial [Acidobacteria bacterium]|nr:HAMP domain-containing protein [Acidobacteriota bacterium]
MRHSLRLRLLVMTGLVSLVAIAAVAVFSSRITTHQFGRYIASGTETDLERYRVALTRHYRERGGWDGVQTTLEQVGAVAGKALILVDGKRHILAATAPFTGPRGIDVGPNHLIHYGVALHAEQRTARGVVMNTPHVVIENAPGETVGTLYVIAFPPGDASHEALFVGAVNRSLLWAALLAGAAALLVAFFMSRRILGPVEALTNVAQRMERGDLSQRVAVQSKDEIGKLARA